MDYKDYLIMESKKDLLNCPHPEDLEFCKKWNLYIKGKGPLPIYKNKKSTGHYKGPRSVEIPNEIDKKRKNSNQKGGRHDWRKEQ